MDTFQRGTTVICSIEIYNSAGQLVSPTSLPTIEIWQAEIWEKMVSGVAMEQDDSETGKYHYDYQTTADQLDGRYKVNYTVTNNSRISTAEDWFELK